MKKVTCLLAALLLACGLSWAQQITWAAADQGYENGQVIESVDFNDYVAGEFFKGSNNNEPKYYTTGAAIRCYGGNYFTITSDYVLTEIVFGFASGEGSNAITSDVGTYENGTWTGSANEVTFTIGGTTGHRRFATFTITYDEGGSPAPSITASNVEIAYDATEGAIAYTINNPVDGGELTAATEAEWLTIGTVGETVPFTCSVNEDGAAREAVVTLTYTYGEQAINQAVTVTQAGNPNALDNISDITATGAYAVQGTIVAMSQRGFIVGDGTGYVYYYNTNYDQSAYAIGDMVKLAGNVVVYGGVFEFNNSTTVTPANSSNYVAEEPTVITGEEMDARVASTTPAQLSNYVQYEGTFSINNNHYNITNIAGATTAIGSISYPLDTEFADLDGHQVKVSGYYVGISSSTYYNTMIGTIEEVTTTDPIITVTPATVEVDAEEHDGTLDLAYENLEISDMTDFDIQYYDAEGEETETPDWIEVLVAEQDPEIGEGYVVSYYMFENEGEARSAYFKVFAVGDEDFVYSNLVTINQAQYVAPALDYAELPFEFDGTYNDIATTDGLTEEGLGNYSSAPHLKFDGSGDWLLLHFIEAPGTLTFDLKANPGSNGWSGTFTVQTSEDGETYTDLATYTDISTNGQSEEFTNLGENVRYIKWIYTEKVNGNVALGNIVLDEYTGPVASITVADATVSVPAEGAEGTLTVTYENITEIIADVYFCDADGQEFTYEWMTAEIDDDNNVEYLVEPNEGEARTAYFKVYAMDDEGELVYSNLVTVNQEAPVVPPTGDEYALYTGELVEGDYVICYNNTTWTAAMKNTVVSGRLSYEEVTPDNGVVITDDATIVWHIAQNGDYWTIYSADANAYAAGTGAKNKAQMLDEVTDFALWSVDGTETYNFVNVGNAAANVNAYLRNNTTYGFACYALGTGGALSLYKKVAEPITETYPLDITGYEAGSDGGYYLIASPVTVNPANVEGMTAGEYDLYSFDQAEAEEWRNYKVNAFNLEPGKGYLYAKQATTEGEVFHFELTGTPYNGEPITLSKSENVDFPGWNLVGNPFGQTAYIDRDFYVMKSDGSEIIESETNEIAVMQGVFVIATNDGEELTFSTEAPTTTDGKIVMNVSNARRSVVDRATVRFGEGRTLPKFMLNDENTKIYFTEGNEEFAVVRSINENVTPVSFHAAENGTYTLSINTENVDFSFFHLIDNMTGNDIDLLSTPSYTFEASTTDYAQRFSLLYATVDGVGENNAEAFAFFNGNEWVVNNEGEANLQVIDMTGRLISSETVNGTATVSLNQSAGIYMLRLVNGNNVKVQKVVVR